MNSSLECLIFSIFTTLCDSQAAPSSSNLAALPTTSFPSAANSAPAAASSPSNSFDPYYDPYAGNADSIGLGVTIAGVTPLVFFINRAVIVLYEWRARRRRRRNDTRMKRRRLVELNEEVGFGGKLEMSAELTRMEMEARERRFEMDGEMRGLSSQ